MKLPLPALPLLPLLALPLVGCHLLEGLNGGEAVDPLEAQAAEQCPKVHLDRLAGDWLLVRGQSGDPKTRLRVAEHDGGYRAWWVGGGFTHLAMEVERRERDLRLTEIPSPAKQALLDQGQGRLARLYVQPSYRTCSLQAFVGTLDPQGREDIPPQPIELLEFPDGTGSGFTFLPPDQELFLGRAARDRAVAEREVAELGGAAYEHPLGTVPVAAWTEASADGDPDCTYDMDLYFDGQPVEGGQALPAGPVQGGWRQWSHQWEVPYRGNHHFQIYRHRTCEGGSRELLGVAALEAVLQ